MPRDPVLYILARPILVIAGFICAAGCREEPAPVEPVPAAATAEEVKIPGEYPFQGVIERTLTGASTAGVANLYVGGVVAVAAALGMRIFTGKWKDAVIAAAVCAAISAFAVLLTDFSGVVLIAPCALVGFLIWWFIKRVFAWWTGYRAWRAAATVIEVADHGEGTVGQDIKDTFARCGLRPVLDKALKPLEKEWAGSGG